MAVTGALALLFPSEDVFVCQILLTAESTSTPLGMKAIVTNEFMDQSALTKNRRQDLISQI